MSSAREGPPRPTPQTNKKKRTQDQSKKTQQTKPKLKPMNNEDPRCRGRRVRNDARAAAGGEEEDEFEEEIDRMIEARMLKMDDVPLGDTPSEET